jgi:hypothetical protein
MHQKVHEPLTLGQGAFWRSGAPEVRIITARRRNCVGRNTGMSLLTGAGLLRRANKK